MKKTILLLVLLTIYNLNSIIAQISLDIKTKIGVNTNYGRVAMSSYPSKSFNLHPITKVFYGINLIVNLNKHISIESGLDNYAISSRSWSQSFVPAKSTYEKYKTYYGKGIESFRVTKVIPIRFLYTFHIKKHLMIIPKIGIGFNLTNFASLDFKVCGWLAPTVDGINIYRYYVCEQSYNRERKFTISAQTGFTLSYSIWRFSLDADFIYNKGFQRIESYEAITKEYDPIANTPLQENKFAILNYGDYISYSFGLRYRLFTHPKEQKSSKKEM